MDRVNVASAIKGPLGFFWGLRVEEGEGKGGVFKEEGSAHCDICGFLFVLLTKTHSRNTESVFGIEIVTKVRNIHEG